MKAFYVTERPSIGQLEEKMHFDSALPAPQASDIKPNEIIVQVKAFSINVDDIHMQEGSFLGGIPGMQSRDSSIKNPIVLGSDFAGIITAVGEKVDKDKYKVGQRVCGLNHQQRIFSEKGTWAEQTVTLEKSVVPIPDEISFRDAAAAVMPLFVIDGLLKVIKPKVKGKERVVVIGASGGIGSMLVKMLRKVFADQGMHITGVCSGRNEKFVLELGADQVVDYTKGPIEETLVGKDGTQMYDIVFDIVGGASVYNSAKAILRKNGQFITCVGPEAWVGDKMLSTSGLFSWVGKILWGSVMNLVPGSHPYYTLVAPTDVGKATFQTAFENGIVPHVDTAVSFGDIDEFKKALKLVRSHRAKGKVVTEIE